MKQKAAITFELEETVVFMKGGKIIKDFCPRCQMVVEMISANVLALLSGVSEREIFRLIEAGHIYYIETERILACVSCYRKLMTPAGNCLPDDGRLMS